MAFDDDVEINAPFPSYANTPSRASSPGRLGDIPLEGPASLYSVEERIHSPYNNAGVAWDEWKEAFLRELQEEERISDLVAMFQDYEIEEEEMNRWAETM